MDTMENMHHHEFSRGEEHAHHDHHGDCHSDASLHDHAGAAEGDGHRKKNHHRIPYNELTDESIICKCNNISFRMVKDAVDNGADLPDAVADSCGCTFMCGKCVSYMAGIITTYKDSKGADHGNS